MRVATWNLGSASDEAVLHGLIRLAEHRDAIGVQEAGDRKAVLAKFAAVTGWRVLRGVEPGQAKVCLLVAPQVKVGKTGWYACTPATYVGPLGAGPSRVSAKWVTWAVLDGVRVGVTHMVASVQTPPFPGRKRRRALYADHIAKAVEWAKGHPTTVLMGDFNATRDYFQLDPLRKANLRCHTRPSHGDRAIDQHWTRGLAVTDVRALDGYKSDHKPVAATVSAVATSDNTRTTAPDPYARDTFHGKPLDNATIAALKIAEQRLGYELTIYQGIGGATASAGTHTEGRAVDLAPYDHERKLRVLKDIGFAAWYRPASSSWSAHIHAILILENRVNSRGLADVGFRQIAAFDARRDGLVSNNPDPTYRPSPPAVFTLAEYRATFQ